MKKMLMMLLLSVGAFALQGVDLENVSSGAVELGEWNSNFNACKSFAEENGYPMLMFWSKPGCGYCTNMRIAMNTSTFVQWRKAAGIVLMFSDGDESVKSFAKNSSGKFPYMRLYWPAGGVDVKFTGRKGMMDAEGSTLEAQLINRLNAELSGYTPVKYRVEFVANGGSRSMAAVEFAGDESKRLPACAFVRTGYDFKGWATSAGGAAVYADKALVTNLATGGTVKLYAVWKAKTYTVAFAANGGRGTMASTTFTYDTAKALPACAFVREGFNFLGWALTADGEMKYANKARVKNLSTGGTVKLYAVWARPSLWPTTGRSADPVLDGDAATTYNAYAYDATGKTVGTLEIKSAKAKNLTTGKSAAVTLSMQFLGEKKETVKGVVNLTGGTTPGVFVGQTKSGQQVKLRLGANGIGGKIGNYSVDGAVNKFMAKDAVSKATAARVQSRRQGAYSVAFKTDGVWNGLSLVVGSKGKTKVTGTLADGSKVSTTAQLMIGADDVCLVAVAYSKKDVGFAFTLWISNDGVEVAGCPGAIGGKTGTMAAGAVFRVNASALANVVGGNTYAAYFPNGVSVACDGKKFLVANGAKAGKVALNREKTGVDTTKTGANPSALKLTYTAKTGAFKGSFKGYVDSAGKPKAVTVTVNGVVLNGVGYGAATIKKVGSVSVEIR